MCAIDCVLVGLDWAKPMMQFLLHVTCSCISHAYVLYFSIYLLYLNCIRAFLIVSFSPPPSLYSMHLSVNPLRPETLFISVPLRLLILPLSLSSIPWWWCHKAFSENFSRRGIPSECQVILVDLADTGLPTVIHSRGWESLCDVSVTCPLVLIQEFYSNMHGINCSVPLFFTRV